MLKTFSGRRASQDEYELNSFIGLLKSESVTRYLEIGARHGDTFHEVMINLPVGSFGVAVDLPAGLWGKSGTETSLQKAVKDLRAKGYDVHMILGDSTSKEVIDKVLAFGGFDAVLIDGDHTFEGVSLDYKNYGEVAPLVAFHDIVGEGQAEKVNNNPVEVPRFWKEVKDDKSLEFVGKDSKMGIGILCK